MPPNGRDEERSGGEGGGGFGAEKGVPAQAGRAGGGGNRDFDRHGNGGA